MRLHRAVQAAALVGSLAFGGCARAGSSQQATPSCDAENNIGVLVLEAQSVPRADRVPCVQLLPAGWSVSSVNLKSGDSTMKLQNDRAGVEALEVRLTPLCNTQGSTQVPSDEPGTQRFERIDSVTKGFAATRFYTFSGGCVSYRFRFEQASRALVNEASLALSFLPRADARRRAVPPRGATALR